MNVFTITTLLSALSCLLIAEIVYHSNKKEALNQVFSLLCLSSAYYLFFYFLSQQSADSYTALLWLKVASPGSSSTVFLLHFALVFTEKKKWLKNKLTYFILYIPALFFSIMALTTDLLAGQLKPGDMGYTAYAVPHNPWMSYIIGIWLLLIISLSLILIVHYYLKTTNKAKKKMIKIFLICLSLLVFVVALPIMNKIKTPEMAPFLILWMNAFIGYGIWKYDLFRIDPVVAVENIISTMSDSLILVDLEGKIAGVNPALVKTSGYPEEEVIGKPMDFLFENKETAKTIRTKLLLSNRIIGLETELETKAERTVPVVFSSSVIRHRGSRNIGFVCIVHDITELKQSEEALLLLNKSLSQSNQDLQDFAHVASHDLQEPLRKIKAFGERLKEKSYDVLEDQSRDYLERILNAAIRMQSLIDDLLTYSRVTTKAEPNSRIDLSQIVKDVLSDLEVRIEKASGRVETDSLPVIKAEPTQMRQLFQNLIGNALKFHKPDVPPIVKVYEL